ncbi:MAG: hypothetical protein WCC84_03485 [Candidatus Cybelea sp.]
MAGPFSLAIDQQDRIWVGNAFGDFVTRFPAADPSKAETFKTAGGSSSGLNVDQQGNVWATNRFKAPGSGAVVEKAVTTLQSGGNGDEVLTLSTLCGAQGVTVFYGLAKPVRVPQIGPSQPE